MGLHETKPGSELTHPLFDITHSVETGPVYCFISVLAAVHFIGSLMMCDAFPELFG